MKQFSSRAVSAWPAISRNALSLHNLSLHNLSLNAISHAAVSLAVAGALLLSTGCGEQKSPASKPAASQAQAPAAPAEQAPAAQVPAAPAAASQGLDSQAPAASAGTPEGQAPHRATAVTAETDLSAKPAETSPVVAPPAVPAGHSADDGHNHGNENPAARVDPNAAAGSSLAQNPAVGPTGPAPRLEADANDHDFGTAIEGEKLNHTFKLKSAGQADLVITSAKPTCGCTIAQIQVVKADGALEVYKNGDPLPPGTELKLTAELDTKNAHGTKSSKINVYCNDPRTLLTLGLTARVDTYFVLTPNALQFGDLSVADSIEKSFQVSGKKPEPFLLTLDNKQLPDGMKIDIAPIEPTPEGKSTRWDCKVTLGPNCKEGNLGFPIQLRSDEKVMGAQPDKDGNIPTYGASVMVTGRVQGLISYEPQYLSFGLVRPGQSVARTLTVKSFDPNFTFGEAKVRLVGPSDQKPDFAYGDSFTYVIKPSEDKKSINVELTLNGLPESVDGSFQGRLMLETGHSVKPEIAVLFSGVCRPGVKTTPAVPAAATPPTPADGGVKGG